MITTRTRISGDYIRPTNSWSGNGRATRTRVSGSYVKPTYTSSFRPGVTRTPVYTSSSWFSAPFRSSWYSTPVCTTPVYTPAYTATPIVPAPIVREPTPVADAILGTVIVVGLVALIALAATQPQSLSRCHMDLVCPRFGDCYQEEICTPLNYL